MKSKDQQLLEEAYKNINSSTSEIISIKLDPQEKEKLDKAVQAGLSFILKRIPNYRDEHHEVAVLRFLRLQFSKHVQDLLDENLTD
jgi:hypothetical protein